MRRRSRRKHWQTEFEVHEKDIPNVHPEFLDLNFNQKFYPNTLFWAFCTILIERMTPLAPCMALSCPIIKLLQHVVLFEQKHKFLDFGVVLWNCQGENVWSVISRTVLMCAVPQVHGFMTISVKDRTNKVQTCVQWRFRSVHPRLGFILTRKGR